VRPLYPDGVPLRMCHRLCCASYASTQKMEAASSTRQQSFRFLLSETVYTYRDNTSRMQTRATSWGTKLNLQATWAQLGMQLTGSECWTGRSRGSETMKSISFWGATTFRRSVLPPFSGSKSKVSKQLANSRKTLKIFIGLRLC
jgi:hypothetical protein